MRWLFRNFSPFNYVGEKSVALIICFGYLVTFLDVRPDDPLVASVIAFDQFIGNSSGHIALAGWIGFCIWYLVAREEPTAFGILMSLIWQPLYTIFVFTWWFSTPEVPSAALSNHIMLSFFVFYIVHSKLVREQRSLDGD